MSYPQFTILNVSCCMWEWMFRTFWTLWDYGSIVTPHERIDKAKYIRSSKKVSPNIVSTDTHTSAIIRFKSRGKKSCCSEWKRWFKHTPLFIPVFICDIKSVNDYWIVQWRVPSTFQHFFLKILSFMACYSLLSNSIDDIRFLFKCLLGITAMMGNSLLDWQRFFNLRCHYSAKMIFNQVHRYEVILYLILLWNSVLVIYVISQQCKRKDMRSCIPSAIGIVNSMQVGLSLSQSSVFSQLSYYSC